MTQPVSNRRLRRTQRGLTMFGLLFWAVVIGFIGYLAVRTFPTVTEYFTIQRIVKKIAAEQPATVAEARAAFDRQREIDYGVTSISGKDLTVTKENDKVVIKFAYEREIPLFGPVFLLLKYDGQSN
ncbi:MAG: DUF4845 domain-containing protein [Rubrivivax sp.]|jgi:hypothetical protein|nr:DUF4845 domain-containing protein [Rubrivivax sp.]